MRLDGVAEGRGDDAMSDGMAWRWDRETWLHNDPHLTGFRRNENDNNSPAVTDAAAVNEKRCGFTGRSVRPKRGSVGARVRSSSHTYCACVPPCSSLHGINSTAAAAAAVNVFVQRVVRPVAVVLFSVVLPLPSLCRLFAVRHPLVVVYVVCQNRLVSLRHLTRFRLPTLCPSNVRSLGFLRTPKT